MKSGVVLLFCTLLVPMLAWGQSAFGTAPPARITETECPGSACLANEAIARRWVFSGILGAAKWNNGAEANVVIDHFEGGNVEIRRIDLPNSSSYGLTAVYKGTLQGGRIEGTVVWSWNGHWEDGHPTGHWSAQIQKAVPSTPLPQTLKVPLVECESGQCAPGRPGGCRWTLHNNEGGSH